jgi:hypothetical protein
MARLHCCHIFPNYSNNLGTWGHLPSGRLPLTVLLQVDRLAPVAEMSNRVGCTVTSDGWSSTTNRPLLNVLAVNPMGAAFLKAVDASGSVKSGAYIADVMAEQIEKLGSDNVVQVVTDNAAACLAAHEILRQR